VIENPSDVILLSRWLDAGSRRSWKEMKIWL